MSEKWPVEGSAAKMLQNMLSAGRLAHAYLFLGPEDFGMKETAIHFAKGILCESENAVKPCGNCASCRRVDSGNHPDIVWLEPEGQTIKIQQIREVQKTFALKAMEANRKVYIVTRAEQMTTEAANALLKFLEEPPTPVVAILIANRKEGLLPTVVSRCQIIPFHRLPASAIQNALQSEGNSSAKARLLAYVKESIGSARKFSEYEKFAEIVNLVVQLSEEISADRGNPLLTIQDKISKPGWTQEDVDSFLDCLAWWYRDLVNAKLGLTNRIVYENQISRIQSQAATHSLGDLVQMVEIVLSAKRRLLSHANQQLALEHMVLQLQGE
ncbi:DNA polymerase III subunit delta' [Effusibacillus lacus]|uniref:DNA polymerase III subunit delta' n=1 Tax=Effusibacillus lacus TaxID=1348429 RepID=A0A292YJY4_9BACL|nr:DNA polymerase III subunit delta' [Effusibacillus lacus]TCS74433.1 DNA polymerase-3 subunit delta' [Effusibacillus lacus]GAX88694.1 DNA polymerase III subunit delta' [Effusibacillus lacus]